MANLQNEIVNFLKNISLRISGGLRVLHRLPVIPWVSVVFVAVIAGSLLTVVQQAQAANGIRKTINFQGKLVDDDGLNVANDDYTVVFTLYNDPSAGTNLWDETQTVSTVDGVFQVELGSVDTSLANVNFNSDQLYLGIKVGADSEMTPRIRFTAVPYAFNADKLNGVTATQSASGFTLSGGTSTVKTLTLNDNFTVNTAGLTFANAKTLGVNHSITLAGVDGTTITFQGSDTYVGRATNDELTNKSIGSTGLTFSGAATDITTGTNESFTIDMNGSGDLIINSDFDSGVSIGSASNTPAPLSISGGIGNNAALIVNNTNSGDLFVASAAGITKFRVANSGDVHLGAALYANGSAGTGTQCLLGGATASWGSCGNGNGSGDSHFVISNGLLYNGNLTTDFAIGGSTSQSAKFKVGLSGTGTTASVAGQTTFAAMTVDNAGFGDLFTASKSGATKFVIKNSGLLGLDATNYTSCGSLTTNSSGVVGCGAAGGGTDLENVTSYDTTAASTGIAGEIEIAQIDITPNTSSGDVFIQVNFELYSLSNTDHTATLTIEDNATCTGNVLETVSYPVTVANGNLEGYMTMYAIDPNPGASAQSYTFCGSTNGPSSDVRRHYMNAIVIDTDAATEGPQGPAGGQTFWRLANGAFSPINDTADLLVGGSATTSAKFGILNVNNGTPTASISAGAAGAAYLTATGQLQTTANQALTLGGATTGNILINPQGINFVGIGTSAPLAALDVRTSLRTGATASVSGRSTHAALFVDNTDSGDLLTASKSGATKFTVLNSGDVRINNLNSANCDVKADTTGLLSCGTDSAGAGVNHMNLSSGLTAVGNTTTDFAVGGTATSSSIFNVTGVNGGQGVLGKFQTNGFSLPTAVLGAGSTTANGYVYVVGGGELGAARTEVYYAKLNNDGSVDSMRATTSLPNGRRLVHVTTLNGYIYATGGDNAAGAPQTSVYVAKINQDGTLGSWRSTTSLPAGVSGSPGMMANSYIYVVGGYDGVNTSRNVYFAKPNADGSITNWTTLTDSLPTGGRSGFGGGVANGYMYVVGGDTNFAPDSTVYFARLNSDGTLGTWTSTQSLPTATGYQVGAVANGYIYSIGGTTNGTLDDAVGTMYFARLMANGTVGAWTTVNNALPATRTVASVVTANGYVYVIGGDSTSALDIANPTTTIYYASTARVSMAANLDLIGMSTRSMASASAGTGGSIFAGNIFSNGTLEVTGNAQIWNGLSVMGMQSLTGGLNLNGTGGTTPAASIAASTTFAGMLVDNSGLGDLFTASKSGAAKFTVLNSGDLRLGNYTTGGGLLYTTSTGTVLQTAAGSLNECLKSAAGGAPTWGSCGTGGGGINHWEIQNGLLYNGNLTTDFAIGAATSTGAKFKVSLSGTQPTASVGGNTANAAFVVDNHGFGDLFTASKSGATKFVVKNSGFVGVGTSTPSNLFTVKPTIAGQDAIVITESDSNTLAVSFRAYDNGGQFVMYDEGNQSTLLNSAGTSFFLRGLTVGLAPGSTELAALDVRGNIDNGSGGIIPVASLSGQTALAALLVDNNGVGDLFTASSSGLNRFVIKQNGNVGIGTTTPTDKLTLNGGNFVHTASGNPTLSGTIDTNDAKGVYISGKYAYIADGASGLQVIDITHPTSPQLVGSLDTSGNASGIFVSGRYAYVGDGLSGLHVIDITHPTSPQLVGTYNTSNFASEVYVSGQYAYVSDGSTGMHVIDISNPANPQLVGTINPTGGSTNGVYVSGRYAYVAEGTSGVIVVDISNPANPNVVGVYDTSSDAASVYVSGRYAYVADQADGLQIVDISNPTSPQFVGTYNTSNSALSVSVSGRYAYVADGTSGLNVIDISTPSSPQLVGTYDTSGTASWVSVSGRYAYVGDSTSGLQVISINGMETPSLSAGNIETSVITIDENGDIGNNLFVRNGINVGFGGLYSNGAITLQSTTSAMLNIQGTQVGKALAIFNQTGGSDIFTASSSGTTRFTIDSSGNVRIAGLNAASCDVKADTSGLLSCGTDNTSPGGPNPWQFDATLGVIRPINNTMDLLIGGASTSSAKFVFGGMGTNNPIATFSGTLMLGAKNNSTFTQQTTWDKISDTTAGTIATGGTTTIASISASISYNGSVYVGTHRDLAGTAEVYRYDGAPGAWTRVHSAAGTLASTTNIGSISAMTVFDGRLYVGTSKMNQGEVYRYEGGTTWTRVTFAAGQMKQNGTTNIDGVSSMAVYQGRLYAGTRDGARAELYRYEGGNNWMVMNNTPGTFVPTNTIGVHAVTTMAVKNGVLYLGVQKTGDADVLRYAGGQTFVAMNAATATGSYTISGTAVTGFDEVSAMTVYNGNVIVGLRKPNGAEVLVMNDTPVASGSAVDTWTRLNQAAGTITSGGTGNIDGVAALSVYNGMLYVGTSESNGAEIYRYTGGEQKFLKVTQSSAGQIASGGSSAIDGVVSMIPSNGDLYIGTFESGKAEVYKHTSNIDRSFGLEFQANPQIAGGEQNSIDNHASIFFLASASANLSSSNGNTGAFIFSHGIQTRTGSYDVAEDYPTRDDSLVPGDLVSIDRNERGFVTKSESAYDPNIIGVYSESPALRLSQIDSRIDGGRAIPIALAGRVPVKVSKENGAIKAGDFLTASSKPGIAMKATKSGVVIGQAMGGFDEDGVGKVTAYIKSATYQGSVASTFAGMETTPATGKEMLAALASQTKPVSVSEVVTDQLVAGLRIVSPEVTADKLQINTIEPATGNDIGILLNDEGTFSVKDASGEAGIVFKSSGDAAFAGQIDAEGLNVTGNVTANTIVAGKLVVSELEIPAEAWEAAFADGGLQAIEARIAEQDARITNLETLFASASALAAATVTPTPVATDSAIALLANMPTIEDFERRDREVFDLINLPTDGLATYSGKITADKLHVAGSAIVEGILTVVDFITTRNLIVDELATFLGKVVFSGDVFFQGRPTFNHDTAGIAIVKKGTDRVEVRFEKEYETIPMVNVNLTLDEVSPMPSEALESLTKRQKAREEQVFDANVRYVVTKRTTKGFVILLDRKVDEDRAFSWIVVAVDNPVVHKGNGDNYQPVSGDIDKNARPISSSIPTIIPTSSIEKRERELLPSPQVSNTGSSPDIEAREEVSMYDSN